MKFKTLLFVALGLSWFIYSMMTGEDIRSKAIMDKAVEIHGGVFSGKEGNRDTYRMYAVKVIQDGRKNRFLLSDVKGTVYTDSGVVNLDSEKAFLNQNSEIVRLEGNVRIVGVSNEVITTQKLLYNKKTASIIAPEYVTIVAPEYNARGKRMVGNVSKRKYKLVGNTEIDIKGSAIKE